MTEQKPRLSRRAKNLLLAAIAGLAGFVSVVITFAALLAGLWLDARYDQDATFTVILTVISVPVSLASMLIITLVAVRRIIPQPPQVKNNSAHTTRKDTP
ncbi:MAG: AtpZ/AtpI family protein [Chloroflexota bacterium]